MTSKSVKKSHRYNHNSQNNLSQSDSSDRVSFKDWVGVITASLAAFMAVYALTGSAPIVTHVGGVLGVPLPIGAWVIYAYVIAQTIAVPIVGFLAKTFSLRRYFLISTCLFVFSAAICAFAIDMPMMLVGRILQGFAGGGFVAMSMMIINSKLPESKRNIGLTMQSMSLALAPGFAPAIAGWITYNFSWQYVFYIIIFVGIFIFAGAFYSLESEPMQLGAFGKLDGLGLALFVVGYSATQYLIQDGNLKNWFTDENMVYCFIIGTVCGLLFLAVEFNSRKPLLNLRLFRRSNFAMSMLVTFLFGFGQGESLIIIVFYIIPIFSYNSLEIGETVALYGLPQAVTTPLVPKLMEHFDKRLLVSIGLIGFAIGFWMTVTMTHQTSMYQLAPSLIVRGLSLPLITAPLSSLVTAQVEQKDSKDASVLYNVVLFTGMTAGIAFLKEFQPRRSQFHSSQINEAVSLYSPITRERIDTLTQYFLSHGGSSELARERAINFISGIIERESSVLGFADTYYVVGWVLLITAGLVFLVRKPRSK